MKQRDETRGLRNKGNRVLLGVGVGFVVQLFAGLFGAEVAPRILLWAIVAAITYSIATPR